MLGAGGLKFIDPLFQKVCVQECRLRGIPIVYDEVKLPTYFSSSLHKILFCVSEIRDCNCESCKYGLINISLRSYHIYLMRSQVAVGMYRLGPSTASCILGEFPDIAVYGKMLSGGYMPLAATLATTETFNSFLGKKKWHALLHGHSFTVTTVIYARVQSVAVIFLSQQLIVRASYNSNAM